VSGIVDRVNKLIALAASPNLHEARNAAVLAARLIREHNLEIREGREGKRKTPQPRRPSSKKTKKAHDKTRGLPLIESPLGGECVVCGKRYRAGAEVYWSDAEGGIHPACIDSWQA
jgi:hypothetical protein